MGANRLTKFLSCINQKFAQSAKKFAHIQTRISLDHRFLLFMYKKRKGDGAGKVSSPREKARGACWCIQYRKEAGQLFNKFPNAYANRARSCLKTGSPDKKLYKSPWSSSDRRTIDHDNYDDVTRKREGRLPRGVLLISIELF